MKKIFFVLFLVVSVCMNIQAETFNLATYNIRNANKGDSLAGNGWGQRYPYIAKLIQFHDFDIFGTQEGKYNQLEDLKKALPGFDYIGVGREDGKKGGEFSAIFYKQSRFKMLDHGDFWLSETPNKPGLGWDAACIRICTWGKFKDKKTGHVFLYYNLHMDHVGVKARSESAKLILKKIQELPKGVSAILSGDFNVDQNNESYKLLNTSNILEDSYVKADFRYEPNGTFNNFLPDRFTTQRIDHIFLTKDFSVYRYGILTDSYRSEKKETVVEKSGNFPKETQLMKYDARMPSDHFPVMVVVEIK